MSLEILVSWLLRRFWRYSAKQKKVQFDRTLPFSEYIVDRWDKAAFLGFGEGSSIYDSSYVFGDVKVGKNVWIGPFTVLDGSGGLEIGDFSTISAGVQIYTHDNIDRCLSGNNSSISKSPVKIGCRSYIGPNSTIARGVEIGDGCVIGANSFVNRDISDGARVAGSPCRDIINRKAKV